MSFSRPCRAAAAVVVAAAILALAPPASADASDEARVLTLIQQTRASVGAPALPVDATLTSAARSWAAKMARDGTISHNVGLGSQVTASKLSENVGMGPNVDVVHQGFLNSPGHRANMVDTGVNAVGVGVAYAGGYVFVVQDYAKLASAPAPNRTPSVPTQLTPASSSTLRSAPAQATARYSDPDGNQGAVLFVVADERGQVVRQVWSAVVCSGCVAGASIAGLPDGSYALYARASDGMAASAMSGASVFLVDHSAPLAPYGLQRSGGHAWMQYNDPDGSPGWAYVYLFGPAGNLLSHGWAAKTCSGCATAWALPPLGPGTYTLYALGYDGLLGPAAGPVSFAV
jgi:hypothetical protein